MYFIGLDVHQKFITVCALTEKGEIHSRCTVRCIQEVVDLIGELGWSPEPHQLCD